MLPLWFFVVPPRVSKEQVVESTMRARSILFLALGTCIASALPEGTALYIPENGLISLNVPLTFGRAGTHSTRTTHPHTIDLYRQLLTALGIKTPLRTPYRFATKVEMLKDCKDQATLKAGVHVTMSCSRPQGPRLSNILREIQSSTSDSTQSTIPASSRKGCSSRRNRRGKAISGSD